MHERSASARGRFFLPGVLLILGGFAVGTCHGQPGKPEPKEELKEKTVKFSMEGKPWSAVFQWLADTTGKPVIADEFPRGTFTFIGPRKKEYTIPQVIDILNNALVDPSQPKWYSLSDGARAITLRPADETNKRVKQIILQLQLQLGGETAVFMRPDIAKELKLSDDQQTKLKAIDQERRKALLPLFLTGEKHEEIEKKVTAHNKQTYDQLFAVLDDRQQQTLKGFLGEPFGGLLPKSQRFFGIPHPTVSDGGRAAIPDGVPQTGRGGRGGVAAGGGRGGSGGPDPKAIADLMFDRLAGGKDFILVADVIALGEKRGDTKAHDKMAAFLDSQGITNGQLTREQFAAYIKEQMKNLGASDMGSNGSSRPSEQLQRLEDKAVQTDLKLKAEQVKKLTELAKDWKEWTDEPANGRDKPGRTITWPGGSPNAWLEKALAGVLDDKQAERLQQIELRLTQPEGGLIALLHQNAGLRQTLGMDDEQWTSLQRVYRDTEQTRSLMRCELYRVTDGKVDDDFRQTMDAFNQLADKKLDAVLTPKQREQLKALVGEPFKGEVQFTFSLMSKTTRIAETSLSQRMTHYRSRKDIVTFQGAAWIGSRPTREACPL